MNYILAWCSENISWTTARGNWTSISVFIGNEAEVVTELFRLIEYSENISWDRRAYLLDLDVSTFDDIENYLTEGDLEGIEWNIFDMSGNPIFR